MRLSCGCDISFFLIVGEAIDQIFFNLCSDEGISIYIYIKCHLERCCHFRGVKILSKHFRGVQDLRVKPHLLPSVTFLTPSHRMKILRTKCSIPHEELLQLAEMCENFSVRDLQVHVLSNASIFAEDRIFDATYFKTVPDPDRYVHF